MKDILARVQAGKPDRAEEIDLSKLEQSDSVKIRHIENEARIEEYAERLEAGEKPSPAIVIEDEAKRLWLCDGFHLREAHRHAKKARMLVHIYRGTREDAEVVAGWANADHGLPLTPDEKRRYVERVRKHPDYRSLSAREIARRCKVSHKLVNSVDHELSGTEFQMPEKRLIARGSQSYLMSAKRRVDTPALRSPREQKREPSFGPKELQKAYAHVTKLERRLEGFLKALKLPSKPPRAVERDFHEDLTELLAAITKERARLHVELERLKPKKVLKRGAS